MCYAHADNESTNAKERWLDRFVQMMSPLVRQNQHVLWSDQEIKDGDKWQEKIRLQLERARAVVLFVSPAFLASKFIANTEIPTLLHRAQGTGLRVFQILISPSMWDHTCYKYPDPIHGPYVLPLRELQTANPSTRTLIEMTEAEQNRVLMHVAGELNDLLAESPDSQESHRGPV